jgi:hypothetical protein
LEWVHRLSGRLFPAALVGLLQQFFDLPNQSGKVRMREIHRRRRDAVVLYPDSPRRRDRGVRWYVLVVRMGTLEGRIIRVRLRVIPEEFL